ATFTPFSNGPGTYNLKVYSLGELIVPPSLKVSTTILVLNPNDGIYGLSTNCEYWNIQCIGYAYRDQSCSATVPSDSNIGTDCYNALSSYSPLFIGLSDGHTRAMTANSANDFNSQCNSGNQAANFPCNNCNQFLYVEACLYTPSTFVTSGYWISGDDSGYPQNSYSSNAYVQAVHQNVNLVVQPFYGGNTLSTAMDLRNQYLGQTPTSTSYNYYGVQYPCLYGTQNA